MKIQWFYLEVSIKLKINSNKKEEKYNKNINLNLAKYQKRQTEKKTSIRKNY